MRIEIAGRSLIFIALLTLISVSSVQTLTADELPKDKYYLLKIQSGQKIDSLFREHLWTIARINRLSPELMLPGTTLKIPYDFVWAQNWIPLSSTLTQYQEIDKIIFINLSDQWLGAYQEGQLIFSGPICSGIRGFNKEGLSKYPTPNGIFKIEGKELRHFSRKFRVWMNYAHFFYHGFAIHAGILFGQPASGGCVRLFPQDAEWLFNWAEIGTKVVIVK